MFACSPKIWADLPPYALITYVDLYVAPNDMVWGHAGTVVNAFSPDAGDLFGPGVYAELGSQWAWKECSYGTAVEVEFMGDRCDFNLEYGTITLWAEHYAFPKGGAGAPGNEGEVQWSYATAEIEIPTLTLESNTNMENMAERTYWFADFSKGLPTLKWSCRAKNSVVWSPGPPQISDFGLRMADSSTYWYQNESNSDECEYEVEVIATWPQGLSMRRTATHTVSFDSGLNGLGGRVSLYNGIRPERLYFLYFNVGAKYYAFLRKKEIEIESHEVFVKETSCSYAKAAAHEMVHLKQCEPSGSIYELFEFDALEARVKSLVGTSQKDIEKQVWDLVSEWNYRIDARYTPEDHEPEAYAATSHLPPPGKWTGVS